MNELLFYGDPVRLNRQEHSQLRFQSSNTYSFAKTVNSVPINGIEFFQTSRHLPILFSCDSQGDYFPLALLSLHDKRNFLANEAGEWADELYVPAFIRRYPFATSDDGTVCFDQKAPHFAETGDLLFTAEGEHAETLDRILDFLVRFDEANQQTRLFCAAAKEHNLFKPFNVQIMLETQEPLRLNGLFIIDEQIFADLPETTVSQWFKAGWLAWVYAHLHSLASLGALARRQQPQTGRETATEQDKKYTEKQDPGEESSSAQCA